MRGGRWREGGRQPGLELERERESIKMFAAPKNPR